MKERFRTIYSTVHDTLILDQANMYLLASAIAITGLDYLIVRLQPVAENSQHFGRLNISPLIYLLIVICVNTALAVFSFGREKEISYLLLSANIILALLVFVLEIFYLTSL
ncbi:MAG: hypothetical protein BWY68_00410 [bacterium ADurb.Bin400]|nr:MAG: hypothetical protein BWY68_00410 [bacterium ADurb.Bin400]